MSSRTERSAVKDLECIHVYTQLYVPEILPPYGRLDDKEKRKKTPWNSVSSVVKRKKKKLRGTPCPLW